MRLRYAWRTWPAATSLVPLAAGAAWAFSSHLDAPLERTILVLLATVGLSCAFVDPAAAVTAPSPTPLRRRLVPPGAIGLTVALAGWAAIRLVAALRGAVAVPDDAELLELTVIAATQLAVGVARRPSTVSIGPGALVAAAWLAGAGTPDLVPHVYPVGEHPVLWSMTFAAAVLVAVVTTADPATKPIGLRSATGERSDPRSSP